MGVIGRMAAQLMRASAFLAAIAASAPAWSQSMPDYCSAPLDQPQAAADWRMRCTIQKLVTERAEAEDKATQFEVNLAEAEARAKAAQKQTAEFWKRYATGAAAQVEWWRRYAKGLLAKWRHDTIARRR